MSQYNILLGERPAEAKEVPSEKTQHEEKSSIFKRPPSVSQTLHEKLTDTRTAASQRAAFSSSAASIGAPQRHDLSATTVEDANGTNDGDATTSAAKPVRQIVNMHAAKTHLSHLVERALAGEEIIIARAGKPLIRLIPV